MPGEDRAGPSGQRAGTCCQQEAPRVTTLAGRGDPRTPRGPRATGPWALGRDGWKLRPRASGVREWLLGRARLLSAGAGVERNGKVGASGDEFAPTVAGEPLMYLGDFGHNPAFTR